MFRWLFGRKKQPTPAPADAGPAGDGRDPEPPEAGGEDLENDPMRAGSLTDITRGLQHAAQATQALVANQYITVLDQYFDQLTDGTLQAKMVRVALDETNFIMVPLVSLVQPRGLSLERMKASLAVRVHGLTIEEATHAVENSDATRAAFKVSVSPRHDGPDGRHSDAVDIELDFSATEPPEAVMRLIDHYANLIQPQKAEGQAFPPPQPLGLKRLDAVAEGHDGPGARAASPPKPAPAGGDEPWHPDLDGDSQPHET